MYPGFHVSSVHCDDRTRSLAVHIEYMDGGGGVSADVTFKGVVAYELALSSTDEMGRIQAVAPASLPATTFEEVRLSVLAAGPSKHGSSHDVPANEQLAKADHGAAYFKDNHLQLFANAFAPRRGWIVAESVSVKRT